MHRHVRIRDDLIETLERLGPMRRADGLVNRAAAHSPAPPRARQNDSRVVARALHGDQSLPRRGADAGACAGETRRSRRSRNRRHAPPPLRPHRARPALSSAAEDRLVFVDTRPGIRVGYWLMVRRGARATVMLLPGGEGGIGSVRAGEPRSEEFPRAHPRHVRRGGIQRGAWSASPATRKTWTQRFRASARHVEDLRVIAESCARRSASPCGWWVRAADRCPLRPAAAALDPPIDRRHRAHLAA